MPHTDTSQKSKENSAAEIEALGGEAGHYGGESDPRTKNAAENLEGSRIAK